MRTSHSPASSTYSTIIPASSTVQVTHSARASARCRRDGVEIRRMAPSVSWQDVHSMLAREPDPRPRPNPRPSLTAHRPSEDAASRRRCEDGAMSTTTTIPGELFLLLTDEAGRQATSFRRQALAAAAIAELLLRERIALSER